MATTHPKRDAVDYAASNLDWFSFSACVSVLRGLLRAPASLSACTTIEITVMGLFMRSEERTRRNHYSVKLVRGRCPGWVPVQREIFSNPRYAFC